MSRHSPAIDGEGSTTDSDNSDRRTHIRFKLAIPAYLHMPEKMVVVPVRTTNLSQGGFLCLTNAALELGTVLHVRIQLSPHESLDCRAQVARVDDLPQEDPPTSAALVAFRFVDLGAAREMQLQRAIVELGGDLDAANVPHAYRSR